MQRSPWLIGGIVIVVLALIACTCCLVVGAAYFVWIRNVEVTDPDPGTIEIPWEFPSDETPEPTPAPLVVEEPPVDEVAETLEALKSAVVPHSDLHDLAVRFLGAPADTPRVAADVSPDYPIGTERTFNVSNLDTEETFEIEATLLYKTEHVYMWVENGLRVDEDAVQEAADLFEEHTYPTNREFFGSEWTPGVDGDPHLSILHARSLGSTVAGYFSSSDSFVKVVRPDSNQMEMFYINIDGGMDIADEFYNGVLAHEFQHMIHWYNDANEDTWLNEGCSELAMDINDRSHPDGRGNYDVGGSEYAYLRDPDTQLNNWPEVDTTGSAAPHYGAAYLFTSYFLDRFGEDATKALVAHEENGMDSVDLVLQENLGLSLTHEDVFADWAIANLLNDSTLESGQYGHVSMDPTRPSMDKVYRGAVSYPTTANATVQQYAVDYIEVFDSQPLRLQFTGDTQNRLIDTDAHSGKYLWWSNRGDESNPRLSRVLDLSSATQAALSFWTWYHIEEDWDYAYVVVGTTESGTIPDDLNSAEITWTILDDADLGCTRDDPNNGNLGCGLTGKSAGWEYREADLSAYVGQEIVVRFEYVTDAAVNQAGMTLDDIVLTVDGVEVLNDDVEAGAGDWVSEGFVRHANVLAQDWIVQLVTFGSETTVTRLLMMDGNSGEWQIPLSGRTGHAVIVVSAIAPVTSEPATYQYTLSLDR